MKWGSNWGGVTDAILGGWKVSAIIQARTGIPITVTDGRGSSLQATRGNERPNCIGNPVPSNQGMTSDPNASADSKWINIDAFERAATGTWGNCGIGLLDAPGYTNLDMTLAKRFNMGGTRQLELRLEAFNVLNHPKLERAGTQHRRHEHLRHHHEHCERPSDHRAGGEVLLLSSVARPGLGSRCGC